MDRCIYAQGILDRQLSENFLDVILSIYLVDLC
jgi:hypothetical protein